MLLARCCFLLRCFRVFFFDFRLQSSQKETQSAPGKDIGTAGETRFSLGIRASNKPLFQSLRVGVQGIDK